MLSIPSSFVDSDVYVIKANSGRLTRCTSLLCDRAIQSASAILKEYFSMLHSLFCSSKEMLSSSSASHVQLVGSST